MTNDIDHILSGTIAGNGGIFSGDIENTRLVDFKTGLIFLLDEFAYIIANPDIVEDSYTIINFLEEYVEEINVIDFEPLTLFKAIFKSSKIPDNELQIKFDNYINSIPISMCLAKIRYWTGYNSTERKIVINIIYYEAFSFSREKRLEDKIIKDKEEREFKAKEERLKAKEEKLKAREKDIKAKEKALKSKEDKGKKHTKMSIHSVTQFYGDNKQLSIFSDEIIDAHIKATHLSIKDRPDSYGVVLNQSQRRVLEGILKAFTDSNYKGDEEIDKATYNEEYHPINMIAGAYSNVDKIPVVRLTQSEIINLSGHDRTQGDKVDVLEALSFLATKQFCFYWVRLKTENSKPVKDKKGDYVKEEVMEVGSILRIMTIREKGELKYYEIHPSAPLLDQVNNYFLLVPNDWREEVKQLTGKRGSSYTYELLLWLRLQYEQIRRYNSNGNRKNKPFKISKSWEEVAIALKMPETMYKANRKRSSAIIQEAYSVAIKLGYLIKVENNGATDILYLNESYYPKPGELV
jgi:hypothetical protein